MLPLVARRAGDEPLKLLAIGAHSDDIEIGCGGTILKLIEEGSLSDVCWVVLTGKSKRAVEAERSAHGLLGDIAGGRVILKDFRDGYLPYDGAQIKEFFEELKGEFSPDLIFTHQRSDLHQDHRVTCELTWNTFRDHLILEYEIPSTTATWARRTSSSPRRIAVPQEDRSPDDPLRVAVLQAVVQGGPVFRTSSAAGDGVQLAHLLCRGVLFPQGAAALSGRR